MASSGKRKTTMAKIAREGRLRERRMDKQAKKDARKRLPADQPGESLDGEFRGADEADAVEPALMAGGEPLTDV